MHTVINNESELSKRKTHFHLMHEKRRKVEILACDVGRRVYATENIITIPLPHRDMHFECCEENEREIKWNDMR